MNNVSINNLSVRGNASFLGDTSMNNVSIRNLSVRGTAIFLGDTSMNNVSIRNLSVSTNAIFSGDTSMNNVSVNNLSINNLSITNITITGTTIFGQYASTPTTIFSTNYNGYFNGIYNTSGVLELGSKTFQRQRLTYDGTGNMSMIWHASPTDYTREAGRFEVTGRNTGTALAKTNGDLNIEFTNTTLLNNVNIGTLTTSSTTNTVTIGNSGTTTTINGKIDGTVSYTGTIKTNQIQPYSTGSTQYKLWFGTGSTDQIFIGDNNITCTTELHLGRNNGLIQIGCLGPRSANIDIGAAGFSGTLSLATDGGTANTVNIGGTQSTVRLRASTLNIECTPTITTNTINVNTAGTTVDSQLNVANVFKILNGNKGIALYQGSDLGNYNSIIFYSYNTIFSQAGRFECRDESNGSDRTNGNFKIIFNSTTISNNVNIGTIQDFTTATTNTVNIGVLNNTAVNIKGSTITIAGGTNYSGTLNLLTDGTNIANTINMGSNGTDINIATSTTYDITIKIATNSTLANSVSLG